MTDGEITLTAVETILTVVEIFTVTTVTTVAALLRRTTVAR